MLRGIQHAALIVSDLEASRRFYGDAIGMEEIPRPATFAFAGAWFRAGREELHLIAASDTTARPGAPEAGRAEQAGLCAHLAIQVDDLDEARARLDEHGVGLVGGPLQRGDGVTQVYVHDPDRHVIELFAHTGEDQGTAALRAPVRG